MTTLHFVRLIFWKDVRRVIPLVVAIFLCTLLHPFLHADLGVAFALQILLLGLGIYGLGLATTVGLLASDSPADEFRFLATRPIPGRTVLYAKLLFLVLFLVIGEWLLLEIDYRILEVPWRPVDHVFYFIETTTSSSAALAVIVLFSLFIRQGPYIVLAMVGLLVGFVVFSIVWRIWFPTSGPLLQHLQHRDESEPLYATWLSLIEQIGFVAVVLLAAWARYVAKWRRGRTLALTAGGMAVLFLFGSMADKLGSPLWPSNEFHPDKVPASVRDSIRLTDNGSPLSEQSSYLGTVVCRTIVGGPGIVGPAYPYYITGTGRREAMATLRSGKTIQSAADWDSSPNLSLDVHGDAPLAAAVIGVKPLAKGTVSFSPPGVDLRAFSYLPIHLPAGEDLTGATISGSTQVEIHRAYVAGSIPLRAGAMFARGGRWYRITKVNWSGGSISLDLKWTKLPPPLWGDVGGNADLMQWVIVSRPRKELLLRTSGSSGSNSFFGDGTAHWLCEGAGEPVPPDWLDGAEMVFIGSEDCGQITVPYQIKDVTLNR